MAEQSILLCRRPLALLAAEDKGQSMRNLPVTYVSLGIWKDNLHLQESVGASLHKVPKMFVFHTFGVFDALENSFSDYTSVTATCFLLFLI